jgi:hypothetical protein
MSIPDLNRYPPKAIAAALRAIEAAKATQKISDHGYGQPIPGKTCEYDTSKPVLNATFSVGEVATALLFLVAGPVKMLRAVPRDASSSYGWKHTAESWGELAGLASYVSNGAFIVAAEYFRVPSRRYDHNSPNAAYALKSLREQWDDSLMLRWDATDSLTP